MRSKDYIAVMNPVIGLAVARILKEAHRADLAQPGLDGLGSALDALAGALLADGS